MALTEIEEALWAGVHNVHDPHACLGRTCPVHNPTDHHMRAWRPIWRADRGILERKCTHGIGHPDPDQFPYWKSIGHEYEIVHGCDGCCIGKFDEWQQGYDKEYEYADDYGD